MAVGTTQQQRDADGSDRRWVIVLVLACWSVSAALIPCHGQEGSTEAEIEAAVTQVCELDEPVVLDDQTRKRWFLAGQSREHVLIPPRPATVSRAARLWHEYLGSRLEEVPEIAELIALGSAAAPLVNRTLQQSSPADEAVALLALVLGRIGDHDSVPVLIEIMQRAENLDHEYCREREVRHEGRVAAEPIRRVARHTYEATVWALQELSGRRHVFDAEQWRGWWAAHEGSFVPVHQRASRQVSREQVEEMLVPRDDLGPGDERLLIGEALAALGQSAIPHLVDPPNSWRRTEMARRFALDELGCAHLLERSELQEYLIWRFHTDDAEQPIGDAARERALAELPFDLFCRVALESDRYYYGEESMTSWLKGSSPELVATFGSELESRIRAGIPVIVDGLQDPDPAVRSVALELADKIGFETDLELPGLVQALLDRGLDEEDDYLRTGVWIALSRFATEQVSDAVSSALLSDDPDLIQGAMSALNFDDDLLDGTAREAAIDRLQELLFDNDLRESAARTVRNLDAGALVAHCEQLLSDGGTHHLRLECAKALASVPAQPRYSELLLWLAEDRAWDVSSSAIDALGAPVFCALAPRLIELSRQDSFKASSVPYALAEMGGPEAFAELIAGLEKVVTSSSRGGGDYFNLLYNPQKDIDRQMKLLETLTGRSFATAEEWLQWAQTGGSEVAAAVRCDEQGGV